MPDAVRRAHNRFPCSRPVEIYQGAASGRLLAKGTLLNVSMSGAFLRVGVELQHRTGYRLKFEGPDGPFEVACRVVRDGHRGDPPGARHYGLALNPTAGSEARLRRLVDLIRRGPAHEHESPLDRSLRSYWSR